MKKKTILFLALMSVLFGVIIAYASLRDYYKEQKAVGSYIPVYSKLNYTTTTPITQTGTGGNEKNIFTTTTILANTLKANSVLKFKVYVSDFVVVGAHTHQFKLYFASTTAPIATFTITGNTSLAGYQGWLEGEIIATSTVGLVGSIKGYFGKGTFNLDSGTVAGNTSLVLYGGSGTMQTDLTQDQSFFITDTMTDSVSNTITTRYGFVEIIK